MYAANELLFPDTIIPSLRTARGPEWLQLVDHITPLAGDHPDKLAFSLMMIRLNGCLECETDSYRAMRGCLPCAQQTLRRYKGSDQDLIALFHTCKSEICSRLNLLPERTRIQTLELVPLSEVTV